jgi:hypothetical protein
MLRIRSILAACIAAVVATPVMANPFLFVGGDAHLEANANGLIGRDGSPPYGAAFGANGGYFVGRGNGNTNAFAIFSHTTSSNAIDISGTTNASRSGNGFSFAYGLGAPNPPGGSADYGYVIDFQVTQPTGGLLNVNFSPNQSGGIDANTYTYGDIYGYLWNQDTDEFWDYGAAVRNGILESSGGSLFGETFPYFVALTPGNYQLYLQSQSYVQGSSGQQFSETNIRILLETTGIPEPMSVAVFGGLVAVGGLVARRRMKPAVA